MTHSLVHELANLLQVEDGEVQGLLEQFSPNSCPTKDGVNISFHYIRLQNGTPRTDAFISKICDHIVTYCLKRDKLPVTNPAKYRQIVLEAKRKFAQPTNGKTGEPGEIVIFFLLDGILRVPKIFSKMSLNSTLSLHLSGR